MERITMSPEIFSGYTNPYPKNMKKYYGQKTSMNSKYL